MKKIKILFILFFINFINSCATVPFVQQLRYADQEVKKETEHRVNLFLSKFQAKGCKNSFWLIIEFGTIYDGDDVVGRCDARFSKDKSGKLFIKGKVIFSKRHWRILTEDQRTTLVMHELGHCILGANHDSGNIIMNEFLPILSWEDPHTLNILDGLISDFCRR